MMPEEGRTGRRVVSNAVQEIGFILIHTVVDEDGFILYYY